jgi:hypothetical protein
MTQQIVVPAQAGTQVHWYVTPHGLGSRASLHSPGMTQLFPIAATLRVFALGHPRHFSSRRRVSTNAT